MALIYIIALGLILGHIHGFQARASPVPRPRGGRRRWDEGSGPRQEGRQPSGKGITAQTWATPQVYSLAQHLAPPGWLKTTDGSWWPAHGIKHHVSCLIHYLIYTKLPFFLILKCSLLSFKDRSKCMYAAHTITRAAAPSAWCVRFLNVTSSQTFSSPCLSPSLTPLSHTHTSYMLGKLVYYSICPHTRTEASQER